MERHLLRVDWAPRRRHGVPPDLGEWPFAIPAVAQVIADGGLNVPPGVTLLVGENGSGKSTLVEALAAVYPRSGHLPTHDPDLVAGPAPSEEDSPLRWHLKARTSGTASPAGFFLRAEAMHAFLARVGGNVRSHGESFLDVLRRHFNEVGVYFMDEPEAALSFRSCLALLRLLHVMAEEGSQVVVATHSPILAAVPGATILQLGDDGIALADWEDLGLVADWRLFLDAPPRYLRHLLAD